jgi:ADP-ribosylglycohydrolase
MKSPAHAMVLASFVADSLALGAHWIYDTDQLDREIGRVTDLLPPPQGSYHPTKKRGEFTHYGDQTFHLLQHLAEHRGHFSLPVYARAWYSFCTNSPGYMDRATKASLQNIEAGKEPDLCGSSSTDLGGPARIAPLVYCYRENLPGMLAAVKAQTALTHNGPGVVDGALFLAASCHAILHGATPREAFLQAQENGIDDIDLDLRLRKCLDLPGGSIRQAVKEFGQMCSINAALPGAVYTVLQHGNNLEEALIETVMAGGDSAARGMVVGMLLGAALGEEKIPARWLNGLARYQEIKTALEMLSEAATT